MHPRAAELIHLLNLEKHPEGGYFHRTELADTTVSLPGEANTRMAASIIYYLLEGNNFSAFHRLLQDEFWFFHEGCPLHHFQITRDGKVYRNVLGNPESSRYQIRVPGGHWMAAAPVQPNSYCLLSCAVTPAFHIDDWYLPSRQNLLDMFPQHEALIIQYTHP